MTNNEDKSSKRQLSSEQLAVLILDALVDGGIVDKDDFEKGVAIATEEINARKAMQDY